MTIVGDLKKKHHNKSKGNKYTLPRSVLSMSPHECRASTGGTGRANWGGGGLREAGELNESGTPFLQVRGDSCMEALPCLRVVLFGRGYVDALHTSCFFYDAGEVKDNCSDAMSRCPVLMLADC